MAKISANTVPVMMAMVCIAILVSTGQAQFTALAPLPPAIPISQIPGLLPLVKGAGKCWLPLTDIPGCQSEIYTSVSSGHVSNIGPACCDAINQLAGNCWSKMFPYHPMFPSLLKNFCVAPSPYYHPLETNVESKLTVPSVDVIEIRECWSSITSTEGCALEVYKSLTSGEFSGIGSACCKAVTKVNDQCWSNMFPFNPFFPPFLKNICATT